MKQTVQKSLALKFKEVLRNNQQIQMQFKSSVQNKIKRQLQVNNIGKSDEEIEELAKDPEKAKELLDQQMNTRQGVHSKINNTVADIESKYNEILLLE